MKQAMQYIFSMDFDMSWQFLAFYHYMKCRPAKFAPGEAVELLLIVLLFFGFIIGFFLLCWALPKKLKSRLALPAIAISMYSLLFIFVGSGLVLFDIISGKIVLCVFITCFLSAGAAAIFMETKD